MALSHNETLTIIALRVVNIGLVVWALALYRRFVIRAGLSSASTHVILGLFTQIPIVALMAGQINYDNALLVCVAGLFLCAQRLMASIKQRRPDVGAVVGVVSISLYGSIIKYAFLPIVAATIGVIVVYVYRKNTWRSFQSYLRATWQQYKKLSRPLMVAVAIALVIGGGLFAQRYAVNLVKYHTPVPSCDSVLDVDTCLSYGPWARDYRLKQERENQAERADDTLMNPLEYTASWVYAMWYRLFFMINGNLPQARYQNYPSLPLIGAAAAIGAVVGIAMLAWRWRWTVRTPIAWMVVATTACYCAALWWQNYSSYRHTGHVVAVNGRYLLPVLVPVGMLMIAAMSQMIRRMSIRTGLAVLGLLLFMSGNGLVSFLVRSDDNWYWPNQTVQAVNHGAQTIINPVVWHRPTGHVLPQP